MPRKKPRTPATLDQLVMAAAYLRENVPTVQIISVTVPKGTLLPMTAFLQQMALVPGPMPTETPDWLEVAGVLFKEEK